MAIQTVTCPACGAQQAPLAGEDGGMKCAFCGQSIDLPEGVSALEDEQWAGSYDEAAEAAAPRLTPEGEAVKAVFVLSETEVGDAFYLSGKVKERKWLLVVETAVLAALGLGMLIMNILGLLGRAGIQPPPVMNWVYVVVCLGLLPVIWLLPERTRKKMIRTATSGNQLTVTLYDNLLTVHIEGRDEADDWQQPYDGSYALTEGKGLFVLTLKSGQLLVIPRRCFTAEQEAQTEARLHRGQGGGAPADERKDEGKV